MPSICPAHPGPVGSSVCSCEVCHVSAPTPMHPGAPAAGRATSSSICSCDACHVSAPIPSPPGGPCSGQNHGQQRPPTARAPTRLCHTSGSFLSVSAGVRPALQAVSGSPFPGGSCCLSSVGGGKAALSIGGASSSLPQSHVLSGHTDGHLCTQGLCALSLLPALGPGGRAESWGSVFLSFSGQV